MGTKEKTAAGHTPTPWMLTHDKEHDEMFIDAPISSTGNDETISICQLDTTFNENSKQDAAFIVEAVNNHDRLVAENKALREAAKGVLVDITQGYLHKTKKQQQEAYKRMGDLLAEALRPAKEGE